MTITEFVQTQMLNMRCTRTEMLERLVERCVPAAQSAAQVFVTEHLDGMPDGLSIFAIEYRPTFVDPIGDQFDVPATMEKYPALLTMHDGERSIFRLIALLEQPEVHVVTQWALWHPRHQSLETLLDDSRLRMAEAQREMMHAPLQ